MSQRLLCRFSEVQICFQPLDYKSSAPGEADEGDRGTVWKNGQMVADILRESGKERKPWKEGWGLEKQQLFGTEKQDNIRC